MTKVSWEKLKKGMKELLKKDLKTHCRNGQQKTLNEKGHLMGISAKTKIRRVKYRKKKRRKKEIKKGKRRQAKYTSKYKTE